MIVQTRLLQSKLRVRLHLVGKILANCVMDYIRNFALVIPRASTGKVMSFWKKYLASKAKSLSKTRHIGSLSKAVKSCRLVCTEIRSNKARRTLGGIYSIGQLNMYGRKEVVLSAALASKVLLTLSILSFSSESQTGRHDDDLLWINFTGDTY